MAVPKKFHKIPGFSNKKSRGSIRNLNPIATDELKKLTAEERERIANFAEDIRKKVLERYK